MAIDPATLPNDVDALKRLVLEQHARLTAHSIEIERLKLLIAKLRRLQFGRSSEKLSRKNRRHSSEHETLPVRLVHLAASIAHR